MLSVNKLLFCCVIRKKNIVLCKKIQFWKSLAHPKTNIVLKNSSSHLTEPVKPQRTRSLVELIRARGGGGVKIKKTVNLLIPGLLFKIFQNANQGIATNKGIIRRSSNYWCPPLYLQGPAKPGVPNFILFFCEVKTRQHGAHRQSPPRVCLSHKNVN